jgi:histidinol-phosphate/aromatic aminotransferase/cobyric acid decarboxylase-like protein
MSDRLTVSSIYGGYWNENLKDFRFMTNPYFPPNAFMNSLTTRVAELVKSYPSTNWYISELYAGLINLDKDRLVLANGASELIAAIIDLYVDHLCVPIPTFDEYINRARDLGKKVTTVSWSPGSEFDEIAFIRTVRDSQANAALLIRPNNPTGSLITRKQTIAVMDALRDIDLIIIDESFLEFCSNPEEETVSDLMGDYPNLIILKSLSKIYGIPGLRLGYVSSNNTDWIAAIRQHLPLWGINALAQYFVEELPKYAEEFQDACVSVRQASTILSEGLATLQGLFTYQTMANFVLCKLPPERSSASLADELWSIDRILINDCSNKAGLNQSFIRLASRTSQDNTMLVDVMKQVVG